MHGLLKPMNVALLLSGSSFTGAYQIIQDGAFDSSVTRAPYDGLFMSVKDVNFSVLGDAYFGFFGGGGATDAANIEHGFKATSGGWLIIENGAALTPVFRTIATATNYDLAITYDANLFAHYWIRAASEDWRRVWISTYAATDPTVFAEEFNDTATRTLSTERFGYLGTGLLVPSVEHAGSVPAATTGNAPDGDMLWRYVAATRPSAGSILLNLRRQDASNYWQNEIVGSNGNHLLDEVVAASSTNRISAAAAVTNGEKITARLIGNQATLYSTNTQDGQYTSAINHLRQLGYDLNSLGTGGVINDLRGYKAYARDESGLGSELVANSDFSAWAADNPVGWTVTEGGTGSITQVAGGCRILSATDLVDISQSILTSGKYYSYTLVVDSYVSGTAQMYTGNTVSNLINISAAGTYTGYFIAVGATAGIKRQLGVGCDMVIASLSYKEVTFVDDALGTLLEGVVA